mmetsp:Transcript_17003/g.26220  ORF Transcript_17003/g.26220 Transcript_17003/m.26220 type:complete len:128 (-) Transcript_17003:637-1020(-)
MGLKFDFLKSVSKETFFKLFYQIHRQQLPERLPNLYRYLMAKINSVMDEDAFKTSSSKPAFEVDNLLALDLQKAKQFFSRGGPKGVKSEIKLTYKSKKNPDPEEMADSEAEQEDGKALFSMEATPRI